MTPTPSELWNQARTEYEGDPEGRRLRYRELMIEHGHLITTNVMDVNQGAERTT